jgi:hypothetical protein
MPDQEARSAAYGFYVYVIAFDQEQFGIYATKEAADEALAAQIAEGGPAWDGCTVQRWIVAGEPELAT